MGYDIAMKGMIDFYLPKFRRNQDDIIWGDFAFQVGKKEIPLKFREFTWELETGEEGHFLLRFHAQSVDRISYAAAYDEMGLLVDDITVEYLSGMTAITAIPLMCDCEGLGEKGLLPPQILNHYGSFAIKELSLSDAEGESDAENTFALSEKILENYNETVKMEAAMIRQLVNMLRE